MKSLRRIYYLIFIGLFVLYLLLVTFSFIHLDDFSQTSNNRFNDITVVIDPGHGGEDGGAVANGIVEKDINLSISKKLKSVFSSSGFNVVLIRDKDEMINTDGDTIGSKKVSDMKNRLSIYNQNENNVVISIHQNKFTQEKYSGAQVFYSFKNSKSEVLAQSIRNSIVTYIQPDNNRECKKTTKDIYLLYNANVPSVIVECGFISNVAEAEKLKTDDYQNQLAYSIYIGFLEYINK
ncbi:MAG: N-acetylmuramoyl-L-alanine amidase [Ruminococcus sp.]